jgi:putative DNA primase/helicase
MIRVLQQLAGYSLTGDTREQVLAFVHGSGGNGKGVFVNTLKNIMGDYAIAAAMETFVASTSDRHPTDLAMLRGARLVTASETEEDRAWAEARIKTLTGGDPITARFMRQDFFTYTPQFKLLIMGNSKPNLRNVDDAMRRRFMIIPFEHKPATVDHLLPQKLQAEWPGILRWMIDGCLDWQVSGLVRSGRDREATDDYFAEQDAFGQWLEDECDCEPGNDYKTATSAELFASWQAYALRVGEKPGSRKAFGSRLLKHGIERKRHEAARFYKGIRLRPPLHRSHPDA